MNVFDHFQDINLTNDQREALAKIEAFLKSANHVFILQGYAGTGKTTLINGLIKYIFNNGISLQVLAPTGRAARILREKTGMGCTIHRGIYNLEIFEKEERDKDDYEFRYIFPLKDRLENVKVIIVDEASMISSKKTEHELFTFGTGKLLDDLITYSGIPYSNVKLIFVGDPAQLPPVGENNSEALFPEYFNNLNISCQYALLKEVVRQKKGLILENAFKLRKGIEQYPINELVMEYDNNSFLKISSDQIPDLYVSNFPTPLLDNGVVISFSNLQSLQYNRAIRKKYFGDTNGPVPGDILLITHNHYHTNPELLNGDFIQLTEVNPEPIYKNNIPVYITEKGKRIKKYVNLKFREVKYRIANNDNEFNTLILESMLENKEADLSVIEMKALFIEFVIRFNQQQKERKEKKLPYYSINSEQFDEQLKNDKFFNALRVKYAYAITGHKSQGGEWHTIFIDYYGRNSTKIDPLRWAYTVTTRASKKCYAANAPYLSKLSKFNFTEIGTIANIPNNALNLNHVPLSPFHKPEHSKAKSAKCWEVLEKLEQSAYQLVNVISLSPYHERYIVAFQDEEATFDTHHNNAGFFNPFHTLNNNEYSWTNEVLSILNSPYKFTYNIQYNPSLAILEELYNWMQTICENLDIQITNVLEFPQNYFVQYFLKTDEKCAYIQFYYNNKNQLTRAIPKSTAGKDDIKLKLLIEELLNYSQA